jgi:PAS domain S-box-containing protein
VQRPADPATRPTAGKPSLFTRYRQACPIFRAATSPATWPWLLGALVGACVGLGFRNLLGVDAVTSLLAAGSVTCLAAAWTGCPLRRAAELHAARRDLERLAENVPGAMFIYEECAKGTGCLRYASGGFQELCGHCAQSMPRGEHSILQVLHPEERPVALHALERAKETMQPWVGEYRRELPSGGTGWIEIRAMPHAGPGGTTCWHGFASDITCRKRSEAALQRAKQEAQRAERAKGELVANVTHELRTPMAAIVGYAELLREELGHDAAKDAAEAVEAITRNGQHALEVIKDLVDAERAVAAQITVSSVPTDLATIAEDTARLLRVRAQSKGITLELERDGAPDATAIADPLRVRQILMNLVGNAIRFTDRGGVRIAIHSDARSVTVAVHDTGAGMDAAQLSRLFGRFAQVDDTRAAGGSGLGLAISRQLAKLLGGNISVASQPGKGSTFRFQLPRVPGALAAQERRGTAPAADEALAHEVERPLEGARILVAEDSADSARLLRLHLERAGASVTWASNGRETVALARAAHMGVLEEPFDLVLMDVEMQGMDGLEATRELRASGLSLPIVALTASAGAEAHSRCLEAGCDDFATKPIAKQHLVLLALRWCRRAASSENSRAFEAAAR